MNSLKYYEEDGKQCWIFCGKLDVHNIVYKKQSKFTTEVMTVLLCLCT